MGRRTDRGTADCTPVPGRGARDEANRSTTTSVACFGATAGRVAVAVARWPAGAAVALRVSGRAVPATGIGWLAAGSCCGAHRGVGARRRRDVDREQEVRAAVVGRGTAVALGLTLLDELAMLAARALGVGELDVGVAVEMGAEHELARQTGQHQQQPAKPDGAGGGLAGLADRARHLAAHSRGGRRCGQGGDAAGAQNVPSVNARPLDAATVIGVTPEPRSTGSTCW